MSDAFRHILQAMRPAFGQERVFHRATQLATASVLCLGRHTISGMITTCGQQSLDWSAFYRLFEKHRVDCSQLFSVIRRQTMAQLAVHRPVVALLDDTLVHKRGRRVHGASWRRDPLGPPFNDNFIWAQRFLQCSIALPQSPAAAATRARAIPIELRHCPSPAKPAKQASPECWKEYRARKHASRISLLAATRIQHLRQQLDGDPHGRTRPLIVCVDGAYTNQTVMRRIPLRTTIIGRIRKDARLYRPPLPGSPGRRGRTRSYGEQLPTPEMMRQNEAIPWKTVPVFAAGRRWDIAIKSIGPVRWRSGSGTRDVRVIIIRPLAYRPRAGTHLLYREPAYLVCSDPRLSEQEIVQYYLWRWEIELNFRDEKTLLGAGEAQVRIPETVETVPAWRVCTYAALLLAQTLSDTTRSPLPLPKWRRRKPRRAERCTTATLISQLRAEVWGVAFDQQNFSSFVPRGKITTKPKKIENTLSEAVFYAIN